MRVPFATAPPIFAGSMPAPLLDELHTPAPIDVVYVHLPFGCELESLVGAARHEQILEALWEETSRYLACCARMAGGQRWAIDDFVGWVVDSAKPSSDVEVELTAALQRRLSAFDLPAPIADKLDDLAVCRRAVPRGPGRDPVRAYARAILDAQRGAWDLAAQTRRRNCELMDRALRDRSFVMHFQPIVDVRNGCTVAHEALCRGTMEGLRFPDVIFELAEQTNRVWELGRVLRDVVADELDQTTRDRDAESPALLFINVHPSDIEDPMFLEQALSGRLARHANRIVVELTERAAISDYRRVKDFFTTLRRLGYRLAIDDLGSGYAGLTALAELEPDFIKFDMSLVRDIHRHPVKQRLLSRMQEFANEIGAQTISEGVENEQERDALLGSGSRLMQGYFFGRPGPQRVVVPADRFVGTQQAATAVV